MSFGLISLLEFSFGFVNLSFIVGLSLLATAVCYYVIVCPTSLFHWQFMFFWSTFLTALLFSCNAVLTLICKIWTKILVLRDSHSSLEELA